MSSQKRLKEAKPGKHVTRLSRFCWLAGRRVSGEEISQEELMRLFEAVGWAPSSFNAQQWRALYARVAALTIGRRSLICSPPQTS
jgi:hypothetical protein